MVSYLGDCSILELCEGYLVDGGYSSIPAFYFDALQLFVSDQGVDNIRFIPIEDSHEIVSGPDQLRHPLAHFRFADIGIPFLDAFESGEVVPDLLARGFHLDGVTQQYHWIDQKSIVRNKLEWKY